MAKVQELMSTNISNAQVNVRSWNPVAYNVLEYKVVGGGVVDDTAALQALVDLAISENRKAIYFPAGQYYVTALTNADQVVFFGDNASFVGGFAGTIYQMGDWATNEQLADMAINVKTYGAKGDGVTDDTASIQRAIDACSAAGGGIVFFPEGKYIISAPIVKKAKVSLIGVGGRDSIISWGVNSPGVVIDTRNESLIHTSIESLQLTKESNVTSDVIGIFGGATLANYNQMQGAFRNLRINKMSVGIDGSADPTGVGIFDCVIENCWIEDCGIAINSCGSQVTLLNNKFHANDIALQYERLNEHTVASYNQVGGIFINNGWDHYVKSTSIRPSSHLGTWHEGSTNGILTIENAGTKLLSMKFENCMLSTKVAHPAPMMNFGNANYQSSIVIDNCTIYPTANGDAYTIARPVAFAADFILRGCIQQNYDASIIKRNQSPAIYNDRTKIATGPRAIVGAAAGWTTHSVTSYGGVPFTAAPIVYVTVQGAQRVIANAANVTASGFEINLYNWEASPVSVTVNWIAVGP